MCNYPVLLLNFKPLDAFLIKSRCLLIFVMGWLTHLQEAAAVKNLEFRNTEFGVLQPAPSEAKTNAYIPGITLCWRLSWFAGSRPSKQMLCITHSFLLSLVLCHKTVQLARYQGLSREGIIFRVEGGIVRWRALILLRDGKLRCAWW